MSGTYTVTYWCTHPDEDNDDCNDGDDFDTKEAAMAAFNDKSSDYYPADAKGGYANQPRGNYIQIDGPDVNEVRMRDSFDRAAYDKEMKRDRERFDSEWQREQANEAGMLHGVEGFNEVMGCSLR